MFDPNKKCITVEGFVSDGEELIAEKCTPSYTETILNAMFLLVRGKFRGWISVTDIQVTDDGRVSISMAEKQIKESAVGSMSFTGTKEDMQQILVFVYFYLRMTTVLVSDVTRAIDKLVSETDKDAADGWLNNRKSLKTVLLHVCGIGHELLDADPGEFPIDDYTFDNLLAAVSLWYETGKETRFIPFFQMMNN